MQKVLATFTSTGANIEPDRDALEELRAQLERHPADGYPIQHATACFHLGAALLDLGRTDEADASLQRAIELFEGRLPLERAKALNLLGAARRQAERPQDAAALFIEAATGFGEARRPLEQGAAIFNLGLTRLEQGDCVAAAVEFRAARELLDPNSVPAQAAAACRELGTALLAQGEHAEAISVLRAAVQLADEAEDTAGMGAAASSLGLALMASGDLQGALVSFSTALAAHPRSIRPADFALVKANVALAHELQGDSARARLAARQALGITELPEAVATTAVALLERLGTPQTADLVAAIDGQTDEALTAFLREELTRLATVPDPLRMLECEEWVAALVGDPERAYELVVTWLNALLELPPPAMTCVIAGTVAALGRMSTHEDDAFRAALERAYARFHEPQAVRVRAMFAQALVDQGLPAWS